MIMTVKELINELQKQDQGKDVMIQQGEDYDYMIAYTVKEKELVDAIIDEDEEITAVVIEYS